MVNEIATWDVVPNYVCRKCDAPARMSPNGICWGCENCGESTGVLENEFAEKSPAGRLATRALGDVQEMSNEQKPIAEWEIIPGYRCAKCLDPARQNPYVANSWGANCSVETCAIAFNFMSDEGVPSLYGPELCRPPESLGVPAATSVDSSMLNIHELTQTVREFERRAADLDLLHELAIRKMEPCPLCHKKAEYQRRGRIAMCRHMIDQLRSISTIDVARPNPGNLLHGFEIVEIDQ